ncbi:MAG: branched-chain alpha-keto acid dehydrogenase subunit E2 [Anaerolinea sp.]|nr:branched-chain alpha-keto acid dehydrogenase subunit E2 [Anaerolinea sp.]
MATVTMPQLGESVTEGTIIAWLKQPGDPVALDDSLCEIETEKVTAELPSQFEGTMGEILVPQGETVEVGMALCTVLEGAPGAAPSPNGHAKAAAPGAWSGGPMAIPPDEEAPAPAVTVATAPAPARAAATPVAGVTRKPDNRERFYSPVVMRLAQEHALDLSTLHGSGIGGRVTRKDVEAAIAQPPAARTTTDRTAGAPTVALPAQQRSAGAYVAVPLSATRRTIAENLKRSNLEAPQAWTMVEADVTPLVNLRAQEKDRFLKQEGVELTLLPYFTAAVCETLREFPMLNARWEGDELRHYQALDIGIAVASEHGLVVPVVHNAGDLSIAGLAKRIADLAQRAHARKLRIEDIEGGTFTVNNTGSFGSIASKPIVNYPQVAIVTMERVVKRPVARDDDAIAVRSMMNVCLSFDHRAMDGLEAGGFLAALKRRLEAIA